MTHISELPKILRANHIIATHDGDNEDFRIHADEMFDWGAKSKTAYKKAEKAIKAINYKGNGWEIYAWDDISGFDYWMNNMKEQNYIQVTLSLDNDSIDESEILPIVTAFDNALGDAAAIQEAYNYQPDERFA